MSWNDRDIPLAVFFTFRCYGTWLHGDARGSVDRHRNIYGTPRIPENQPWHDHNDGILARPPVILNSKMRRSVEKAIRETCEIRNWALHAVNIRTNHGHLVANIRAYKPSIALAAFKANATRQMRQDGVWSSQETPGPKRAVKGICGMKGVWQKHVTMF